MNPTVQETIANLKQLSKIDYTLVGNIKALELVVKQLGKHLSDKEAKLLASQVRYVVPNSWVKYPAELEEAVVAFSQLIIRSKAALEELVGDCWLEAIKANPPIFQLPDVNEQ